jgi:hypothetical protein
MEIYKGQAFDSAILERRTILLLANTNSTKKKEHYPRRRDYRYASFRVMELAKAGSSIELEIFASKEKIGTLEIGRGSLFWYRRSRHSEQ